MAPLVSVVIVNFNGRHHLERCLPALHATRDVRFETIVVDNASMDGSRSWLQEQFPEVDVLPLSRNAGFGEANLQGVARASGEYVAFLNNDTVVQPDWLAVLVKAIQEQEEVGAVCSVLRLLDRPYLLNARGGGMTWLGYGFDRDLLVPWDEMPWKAAGSAVQEVLFPTAAAMLMRRRDFKWIGGFDPAFFIYHEDVDLGWRLWLLGKRVLVCRDSVVHHARGGSSKADGEDDLRTRMGACHALRSLLKNYGPVMLVRALSGLLKVWIRTHAFALMVSVVLWNIRNLPGTLLRRIQVQGRRVRRDRDLFRRGLISGAWLPPPTPEPPRVDSSRGEQAWVCSPRLRPGHDSALGRLGFGWYSKESFGGRWFRWTCGHARCFLRVAPRAQGRLVVRAHLPEDVGSDRVVRVVCNGIAASRRLDGEAEGRIPVTVRAGADGLLSVEISSPNWVPHERDGTSDWRRLGCAVREVRFEAYRPPPRPSYSGVSVIIPTFNRRDILRRTLEALEGQTWRKFEVIVVDDGSTDGTWERLRDYERTPGRSFDLRLVRQPNLKPAAARNAGLKHARRELILFLGDDILPDPKCVESHVTKHNQIGEDCAIVGFVDWHREVMKVTPLLEFINSEGPQFGFGHLRDGADAPFTCFYTANVSVPRTVLGEYPFDARFDCVGWEDTDLGYRLSLRGLRIIYHREASARHLHPMSMAGFYERQRRAGRNAHVLLSIHPDLRGRDPLFRFRAPRWAIPADRAARLALPFLGLLDRLGVPLRQRDYRRLLACAYFAGYADGRPADAHRPV